MAILETISKYTNLQFVSQHRGGEYHGACPFCGGNKRFRVQPEQNFFACRECGKSGDETKFLVEIGEMTSAEAARFRRNSVPDLSATTMAGKDVQPPSEIWRKRAREFYVYSLKQIAEPENSIAIKWLTRVRKINHDVVAHFGLGYNPKNLYDDGKKWGKPGKRIWIPAGIVIPWFVGDELWKVNIRRKPSDLVAETKEGEKPPAKYMGPAGGSNALFNANAVKPGACVVMTEGEFNAIALYQAASELVVPVAIGGCGGARKQRWINLLLEAETIFLAFDEDTAGQSATDFWTSVFANAVKMPETGYKDINDALIAGFDIAGWVKQALNSVSKRPEWLSRKKAIDTGVAIQEPAQPRIDTIRLDNGVIMPVDEWAQKRAALLASLEKFYQKTYGAEWLEIDCYAGKREDGVSWRDFGYRLLET